MNMQCLSFVRSFLAVVLLFNIVGANVYAAEWRIEPVLRVAGEVDDNATLNILTDAEADISGYVAEIAARFAYSSPTTSFFVTPKFVRRDYGDPRFDSDDQFLRMNFSHDTKSTNFRFLARYDRENVRTAERADVNLEVDDPDEIPTDDSGLVGLQDRRERFELVPRFSYRMSEVSSLNFDLRYLDVRYDEKFLGILNDYTDSIASLTYRRRWSPRYTAILGGRYRNYEAEGKFPVSGVGIHGGFESKLSETTVLRTIVGLEDTEYDINESSVDWVADISLLRRLETITLLAQYRRVIAGNGGGTLAARDMFSINFTRALSERVAAGLGVRAYSINALEEGVSSLNERDYVQLRAHFMWNISRTVAVETDYRYTILERKNLRESANSNNIMVWLSWRPNPTVW